MAEEYKLIPKKVSEFPEASTIDGSFVVGVDKEGKSVKVPIDLLKGNQGDIPTIGANGNWWISGKDTGSPTRGQDGEVTAARLIEVLRGAEFLATEDANGLMTKEQVKQLNEILEDMKTDDEKYENKLICHLSDLTVGIPTTLGTLEPVGSETIKYKVVWGEQSFEASNNAYTTLVFPPTETNHVVTVYFSGKVEHFKFATGVKSYFLVSKPDTGCIQINLWYYPNEIFDMTNMSGWNNISADYAKIKILRLGNAKGLIAISVNNCSVLTTTSIRGAGASTLTHLHFNNCPLFTSLIIGKTLSALLYASFVGTPITESQLDSLITNWASRVGKEAGTLRISYSLYEVLSEDMKNRIAAKNINIQYL